jgi:hypothetical protein
MTYSDFIGWKSKKNNHIVQHKSWWVKILYRYGLRKYDKSLPYTGFTKSQKEFAEYLFAILEQPESQLSQHMMNIGDLRTVFEQVYFYCKDQKRK